MRQKKFLGGIISGIATNFIGSKLKGGGGGKGSGAGGSAPKGGGLWAKGGGP